jgi:Kef-type K+ transport system membrane component KefB
VFLPLFFASSGIKTDIGTLGTARYWGITLAIVLVATIAKFTPGCLMTKWVARQNWRFSVAMGLLMNTRGLVEIIALNVGLSMVSAWELACCFCWCDGRSVAGSLCEIVSLLA